VTALADRIVTKRDNTMATDDGPDAAWREQLSALADGELDDAAPLCAAWRSEVQVRETWHTYHLIGDVLRSEDLAVPPGRDAALLGRLRECLASEPTVLAPQPLPAAAQERRWSLRAAMAVTAGVVAVGSIYGLMRPAADPTTVARNDVPSAVRAEPTPARGLQPAAESEPVVVIANGNLRLIRDARLDAYLAAHKQFPGSSALGMMPPSVPASLETTVPGR
jgi:sigma-E factor negative regulatory protein RseA